MIKRGLQIPVFPDVDGPLLLDTLTSIARAAEDSGFDSVWVMDHFNQITGRPADPMLEGYVTLAALAARTSTVQLGTLVTGVTHRNPAVLAKTVTTLDVLSGGRAILGIGGSWNVAEQKAYGIDFPEPRERLDRLEEATRICRLMFTEASPSFEGRYYRIADALNEPRPVRPEGIPILIGGGGEKRTLRIVAELADACNVMGDADTLRHKMKVLDEHCAAVGRDPAAITRTVLRTLVIGPTDDVAEKRGAALRDSWGFSRAGYDASVIEGGPDTVAERLNELREAGADGVVVNMPDPTDLEAVSLAGRTLSQVYP